VEDAYIQEEEQMTRLPVTVPFHEVVITAFDEA